MIKYHPDHLNLNSFYDKVSYVSQEAPIFDGTLRENLVFDKKISDTKIKEVLKEREKKTKIIFEEK